jgi:hypothetical protein
MSGGAFCQHKEGFVMSQIALANIFISIDQTQSWTATWTDSGWQGNFIVQPQPLNPGASMSYTNPSVSMGFRHPLSFSFSVTNHGEGTFYNLQISTI